MTTAARRPFIAAIHVTLDGYSLGPDGQADWVDSWADALDLLPRVDAFVLGGGMFPGYEAFWAAIRDDPAAVGEWLGWDPCPREIEYARIAAETPHLVTAGGGEDAVALECDIDAGQDRLAGAGQVKHGRLTDPRAGGGHRRCELLIAHDVLSPFHFQGGVSCVPWLWRVSRLPAPLACPRCWS